MLATQQAALEKKVAYDLNVARDVLNKAGGASFSPQTVKMEGNKPVYKRDGRFAFT